MQYRYLGNTGLKVSELCLGAMTFGRETDESESVAILDRFVSEGGNFIDTANVYSQGASEAIVGRWLRDKSRHELVIASKVRFPMGAGPNDVGLSRKHIFAAAEATLRRLNTDHLDLYQLHCWDPGTPLEESLSALEHLVQRGWVRYVGVSNFAGWQLQKAIDLARHNRWQVFSSLQPQYNLLCRSTEWDLLPICQQEGLGVIPWSPLRGGWLAGRVRRGMEAPPEDSRIATAEKMGWSERWSAYANEHTWKVLDALHEVSEACGKSAAQIALNWVLCNPAVTAPVIGVRTMRHLDDNLGATGWVLPEELHQRIDEASAIDAPYPYDFIAMANGDRGR